MTDDAKKYSLPVGMTQSSRVVNMCVGNALDAGGFRYGVDAANSAGRT